MRHIGYNLLAYLMVASTQLTLHAQSSASVRDSAAIHLLSTPRVPSSWNAN